MEKRHEKSPPKHRHDGTSPLPLGMDWSPPPKIWAGRETVWPHDHRTGWSYCVTIPSWVVLPKSRDSDPIVFYRVLVGIQSPEGVTTTRPILRRFNDFLKFMAALKKAFPRKSLPPAPPKGFLQLKTRALLEERRRSLEGWMGKLLSDIDIARSAVVASYLELEAAARSSFQDENQNSSESNSLVDGAVSSLQAHPNLSLSKVVGSSTLTSDYGSDTAYQTSETGTPSLGRDNNSEAGTEDLSLDEDLRSPIDRFMKYGMSNIDEGLFMGQAILEQLENIPRYTVNAREINKVVENNVNNGNSSTASYLPENMMEFLSQPEHGKMTRHARKLSAESIGSDMSSQRGSEASTSAFPNSFGHGSVHLPHGAEVSGNIGFVGNTDIGLQNDMRLLLPINQRQKLNGVLSIMQRRLVTAKNDMEDLISRLNQEIAVKDYLTTKVKDLEVELETTNQKSKENLEQAVLLERARITQMQWDMEELRRKSMEMELRLNSQEDKELNTGSSKVSVSQKNDELLQELNATKKELEDSLKRHQELELKSKADIKVLVKEVKSLRSSHAELKKQLGQSLQEKSELQGLLRQEKLNSEQTRISWRKWLSECEALLNQLNDCKVNLLNDGENVVSEVSSLSDALDLLTTSDNKINVLLDKVERLWQDVGESVTAGDNINKLDDGDNINKLDDDTRKTDEDLRKMLKDMIIENGELRKQVNSVIRRSIKMNNMSSGNDGCEAPSEGESTSR